MTMIGNFATSLMLVKVGGAEADQNNNAHLRSLRSLVSASVYAALTFVTSPCQSSWRLFLLGFLIQEKPQKNSSLD